MACAGALATAVLLSGAGAGIALADPDESPSADGASAPDNPEGGAGGGVGAASDGGESTPEKEPPPSTVGNGREDEKKPPAEEEEEKPAVGWGWPKFKHSLSIPILRIPTPEEVNAGGLLNPEMYFGSIDVPVPSIDGFLSTLSQPTPEPTPQPSFRTQQEAPVLDITGNGGGYDPMAAETGAPPVYQLPMVVAPAIPIPASHPPSRRLAPRQPLRPWCRPQARLLAHAPP